MQCLEWAPRDDSAGDVQFRILNFPPPKTLLGVYRTVVTYLIMVTWLTASSVNLAEIRPGTERYIAMTVGTTFPTKPPLMILEEGLESRH